MEEQFMEILEPFLAIKLIITNKKNKNKQISKSLQRIEGFLW